MPVAGVARCCRCLLSGLMRCQRTPFTVTAAGRAAFRTQDLLELAGLVAELSVRLAQGDPASVRQILP